MTEIEHYRGATPVPVAGTATLVQRDPAQDPLDGWIRVMADVAKLAEYIADTELVPDAIRRKPAAVAAIILSGREMNLPPMMSLRHLHIVKGKPGMSAELMRAQVLAAGHEIEYLETSDSRVTVKGRRRGESEWLTVSFTADQARRAKIDLGGYPEDKLVARATSRLCRRKFADCIAGIPSVDELEDEVAFVPVALDAPAPDAEASAPAPARTVQRKPRATKTSAPARGGAAAAPAPAAPAVSPAGPPLPGEDGYDEPHADDERGDPNRKSTTAQNRMMHALFNEAECTDRDERLKLTGLLLQRELDTSAGLTVADAGVIIDALEALKASGHPDGLAGAAAHLLNEHDLAESEKAIAAEQAAADDDAAGES
ncbi:MAG: hypothetical protein EPO40_02930 [Myxococcaceae bacterium]|nr:MAG: hypothetical protein EPO40_02930 [Myxococcaceae bacterium]